MKEDTSHKIEEKKTQINTDNSKLVVVQTNKTFKRENYQHKH